MKYACFRLSQHWHLSFFLLRLHHAGHFIVLNSICSSQALSWSRWPESMFTWLDLLCAQRDQCQHIAKWRPFCTLEDSDLIMVLKHHVGAGVELQLAIGVSRPRRILEIPMEYYLPSGSADPDEFWNSNGILLYVELIVPNGHTIFRQDPDGHLA